MGDVREIEIHEYSDQWPIRFEMLGQQMREALGPIVEMCNDARQGDPHYADMDGDMTYTFGVHKDTLEAAAAALEETDE